MRREMQVEVALTLQTPRIAGVRRAEQAYIINGTIVCVFSILWWKDVIRIFPSIKTPVL